MYYVLVHDLILAALIRDSGGILFIQESLSKSARSEGEFMCYNTHARALEVHTSYEVRGTWYEVQGTRYKVRGTYGGITPYLYTYLHVLNSTCGTL